MNIQRVLTKAVVLIAIFTSILDAGDNKFESAISDQQSKQYGYNKIRTKFYMEKDRKAINIKKLQQFLEKNKGTELAADSIIKIISYYVNQKDKEGGKIVDLLTDFDQTYPNFISLQIQTQIFLKRVVSDKDYPKAVRLRALDQLKGKFKKQASNIAGIRAFIYELEPEIKSDDNSKPKRRTYNYPMASEWSFASGKSHFSSEFLLGFLEKVASQNPNHKDVIKKCDDFLDFYGKDSMHYTQCLMIKLKHQSLLKVEGTKEKLKELLVEEKKLKQELKEIFVNINKYAKEKKYELSIKEVKQLKGYPAYLIDDQWRRIIPKTFPEMAISDKLKFFKVAIDVLPECRSNNDLMTWLMRDPNFKQPVNAEKMLIAIEYYLKNVPLNMLQTNQLTHYMAITFARPNYPNDIRLKTYNLAAKYAEKAGIIDSAAKYLFSKAKLEIDENKNGAIFDLKKILKIAPNSHVATKASWLLSVLLEESSLVQNGLPRSERYFSTSLPRFFNAYPKYSANKIDNNVVSQENNQYTLSENNSSLSVIDSTKAVISYDAKSYKAVVGFNEKKWMPKQTPCAILLPLKKLASLSKIVVEMSDSIRYYVDLLDADKKIVRRYERTWSVWDNLNSATYWPKAKNTFLFPPVANIAFIKVVILDNSTRDASVKKIEAFESKFPAQYIYKFPVKAVSKKSKTLNIKWSADEPEFVTTYKPDVEWMQGFPLMRWIAPWKRRKSPLLLRTVGQNLGVYFFGTAADIYFTHIGGMDWSMDLGKSNYFAKTENKGTKLLAFNDLKKKYHLLQLKTHAFKATKDTFGQNNIGLGKIMIKGRSTVDLVVRFKEGQYWSKWSKFNKENSLDGKLESYENVVNCPRKSKAYQLGFSFDTRAAQANISPTVKDYSLTFASSKKSDKLSQNSFDALVEIDNDIDAVIKAISERKVVVTYSKTGTQEEYEIAKNIAEKAGLYLVPDDIGLNNYPGIVLAIGTPLNNRYCNQLIARYFVWDNNIFLNNEKGYIGKAVNGQNETDFYYVTANSPEKVVEMAKNLLSKIKKYSPPKEPFRVVDASTVEVIYPWKMYANRSKLKSLKLTMAQNDRRSIQCGINFNHNVATLTAKCSDLVNAKGAKLATPKVRFVGFYEFFSFFGNLRLPDLLVDKPNLPIAKNTSMGLWITVASKKNIAPGIYKGKVTVSSGDFSAVIPVSIKVIPVEVPKINYINTYSYVQVPYWYQPMSEVYLEAYKKICKNEAEHSVSMVHVRMGSSFTYSDKKFTFDFSDIMKQMKIADKVYQALDKPLPEFFAMNVREMEAMAFSFLKTKEERDTFGYQLSKQLTQFVKKNNLYERFYLKVGDEPHDFAKWINYARPYKEGGIQVTTAHGAKYPNLNLGIDFLAAWCPNFVHNVLIPLLKERKKAGDKVWWYICGNPMTRITGKAADNLPFYWLTAKWNFKGAHSYSALAPKESGSEGNDIPFRYDHGMSFRMLFLPDGSLIDTTRRELESEGIKDCLLLYKVKDEIANLAKNGDAKLAKKYQDQLDALFESIVPYKYGYPTDAKSWDVARAKLYAIALEISK